jgi:Glycosyl transferases group 1
VAEPVSGAMGDGLTRRWVLLSMGRADRSQDDVWVADGLVRRVLRLEHAVPSGRRFGSLALGLGVDSLVLALEAVVREPRGPFLVTNPWIAVALRLLGRRDVAVTAGIYAVPGSRTHRILYRFLRTVPIVSSTEVEAVQWTAAGGRAAPVLFGATFGYPQRRTSEGSPLRVFIGGSSDRDAEAVAALEEEIRASSAAARLTVVDGSPPNRLSAGSSEIIHPGYVDPDEFGRLLADSDVVVLPLKERNRAAGHMVLVGALEAGVPVLASPTSPMREYIDGTWVRALDPGSPLLPQVQEHAASGKAAAAQIREFWRSGYSLQAYVQRVGAALRKLQKEEVAAAPGEPSGSAPRNGAVSGSRR